ncbi:hypothetical protein DPMN_157946 [Dreissena polymorpha]|uniref:Uncharacterized protein n=1 Tax=Dreissena polymorpha TaxID=45954 RepID=A0A9D4EI63_DREPO|nr:hypothetical protein DPMN_157946 [Dreissena polymorpha]
MKVLVYNLLSVAIAAIHGNSYSQISGNDAVLGQGFSHVLEAHHFFPPFIEPIGEVLKLSAGAINEDNVINESKIKNGTSTNGGGGHKDYPASSFQVTC